MNGGWGVMCRRHFFMERKERAIKDINEQELVTVQAVRYNNKHMGMFVWEGRRTDDQGIYFS